MLILVVGRNNGYLQSSYYYGLNLLMVSYILVVRPYSRPSVNFLLIVEEITTLTISIIGFRFRIDDRSTTTMSYGFMVIGCLGLQALFSFGQILLTSFCTWRTKRREKRNKEEELEEINAIYE